MKEWPRPFKVHVRIVGGGKVFDDYTYYDHESHARMRMRDLIESNEEADDVAVRLSRQRRLRGDFAISEEPLAFSFGGRIRTGTTYRDASPSPPEAPPPAS